MRCDAFRRDFIVAAAGAAFLGLCAPAAVAAPAASGAAPVVLVVGDSLSAEYGIARGTGWVALLEKKLATEKIPATVVNASVSGDTTAGGRSRLPGLLAQHKPSVVVIELGGNDALRGLPLQGTEANLRAMAEASRKAGAKVLIVGMQVPPNYGSDYTRRFESVFPAVAKATDSALVPFLLKGVADRPDAAALFQADRIHPRAEAHPAMLANVWPELRKLLR
ncbi:arylesterase [Paracidovorax avenae]|uniref:arylesterase n=1 Tax=Paracidovorax avenae TaxID=80867 RepID=UPI000D16B94C|nr:arylesterase [Paracidovorax avenae]AVS62097.1 arylesterase [Paracidovorax avenae]